MNKVTNTFIELLNVKDLTNLRDVKALYLLNVLNKVAKIVEYKNRDVDEYNDDLLKRTVKETMLFKGKNYNLTFLYKDMELSLYREDRSDNISLSSFFNKSELDYITDFLNSNDIYTKESISNIKDKLIKSLDDKVEEIILYKKVLKAKKEREDMLKEMLYELIEENNE